MNRYASTAIGLYFIAVIAQALTWANLSSPERSSCIVLFLLVAAVLAALLSTRSDRD